MLNEQFEKSLAKLLRAADRHYANRRRGASIAELVDSRDELVDVRLRAQRAATLSR